MSQFSVPKLRSIGASIPANTATTTYTCPANYTAKVVLLLVCNLSSGNKTVQVHWYDTSAGGTYHIVSGYTISGYNFLKFDQSYLILNAGDYISITTEAGSTMDSTITVEEYYDPALGT
jgi:hypothetical protein